MLMHYPSLGLELKGSSIGKIESIIFTSGIITIT